MNIIGNTCIGARLYQLNNSCYTNPFMWSIVDADSMIKLIENYKHIDFYNYDISKSDYYNRTSFYRNQYKNELKQPLFIFKITIDGLVDVHYVHYRFNAYKTTPTVNGANVEGNRIYEYVVEKYISRVKRMVENNEQPKFVVTALEYDYTFKKQQFIANLDTEYKTVIICDNPERLSSNNPNILIRKLFRPYGTCMNLAKHYNDVILNF